MNCNDYLAMLATLPVDELAYGQAREHAAHCHDCDRVTRVVAERERNMRLAFDDVQSFVPSAQISTHALERSRRRRIVRYYEVALAITTAASLAFFVTVRRGQSTAALATVSETFQVRCISPEHAASILRGYLPPASVVRIPPRTSDIIAIQTSPEDMQKVRSVLDRYDNPAESQCAARIAVPKAP
jgi:hypothetical protein